MVLTPMLYAPSLPAGIVCKEALEVFKALAHPEIPLVPSLRSRHLANDAHLTVHDAVGRMIVIDDVRLIRVQVHADIVTAILGDDPRLALRTIPRATRRLAIKFRYRLVLFA